MTAEVGLGQLGTAGCRLPLRFLTRCWCRGRAPGLFEQGGEISLPGVRGGARRYDVVLVPTGSAVDASGYSAKGTVRFRFDSGKGLVAGNSGTTAH